MTKKGKGNRRNYKGDVFFLSPVIPRNADTEHNRLIVEITKALYRAGYQTIWYDHVKEFVPRTDLPNTIGPHRVDIVVETKKGKYAMIDIEIVEKWQK